MERWRKQLEKTLDEVVSEIGVLAEAKESCERALEAKALPHDVVTECLSVREGRREYEVVRDPVESSLNNENHLIEKIRSQLKVIPKKLKCYFEPRVGVIIKCPLHGLFHEACYIILTSQTAVRELDDDDDDIQTLGNVFYH